MYKIRTSLLTMEYEMRFCGSNAEFGEWIRELPCKYRTNLRGKLKYNSRYDERKRLQEAWSKVEIRKYPTISLKYM